MPRLMLDLRTVPHSSHLLARVGIYPSGKLSRAEFPTKPSTIEIIHRDPLQVTVSDINRLFFNKTKAHRDLLHSAPNLTALPQNWTDDPMQRALPR